MTSFYVYETQAEKACQMKFWYEMLYRPVSIGCQPKGIVDIDETKGAHGVVAYDRELTDLELEVYEMAKWEVAE